MNYERIYKKMFLIKKVEEKIASIYHTDVIKSPVHLSIGQEAVAAGVCEALGNRSVVFGGHRSHALYLAKGGNLKKMIAELYGKESGCSGGYGGSMHLIDLDAGVMGTSSIVASIIPIAVGYAYSLKIRGLNTKVAVFIGDGATDEGVFYESINFAALHKLNILFVCENNYYAATSHIDTRYANDLIEKVAPWKNAVYRDKADGMNPIEVFIKTKCAIEFKGPSFIVYDTFRFKEHVGPNDNILPHDEKKLMDLYKEYYEKMFVEMRNMVENASEIEYKIEMKISDAFKYAEEDEFPTDIWEWKK